MLNSTDKEARLPGVLCETRLPNLGLRPLRLDVAAFVGLAERGPLDVPVMVEDVQPIPAHLWRRFAAWPGLRAGRCSPTCPARWKRSSRTAAAAATWSGWPARATGPTSSRYPGLLQDKGSNDWQPVVVPAAWPGRWSDLVSLATSLRLRPLQIRVDSGSMSIEGSDINDAGLHTPFTPAHARCLAAWRPVAPALEAGRR